MNKIKAMIHSGNTKKIAGTVLIAFIGGLMAVFVYAKVFNNQEQIITTREYAPVEFAKFPLDYEPNELNFINVAEYAVHTVVHVKTESTVQRQYRNPLYEFFYGQPPRSQPEPVVGIGSGVIISDDGYIVTNHHVIKGSDKVTVTLNDNRDFEARIIGVDPSTDLALLKIEEVNLPNIEYGNSDELRLGEWVLAVGNPFNLTSTVTAGIVSAKGRSLNILEGEYRIESFIQTDAALNRGNSGGALVNLRGELVGVNTAIISPSGGYAGNSFAIPVSIVQKVVEDLKEFGEVQRAILGVQITSVTAELAREKGLNRIEGVYVSQPMEGGAAKDAGIKEGDVILRVNNIQVNSTAELQEQISRFRPGDKVNIEINRDNKRKQFEVTLRNMHGTTKVVKKDEVFSILGATFANITQDERDKLGIKNGVKITSIGSGKIRSAGIEKDFIITRINNKTVDNVEDIRKVLENVEGGVYIEGVYPNGMVAYYAFGM